MTGFNLSSFPSVLYSLDKDNLALLGESLPGQSMGEQAHDLPPKAKVKAGLLPTLPSLTLSALGGDDVTLIEDMSMPGAFPLFTGDDAKRNTDPKVAARTLPTYPSIRLEDLSVQNATFLGDVSEPVAAVRIDSHSKAAAKVNADPKVAARTLPMYPSIRLEDLSVQNATFLGDVSEPVAAVRIDSHSKAAAKVNADPKVAPRTLPTLPTQLARNSQQHSGMPSNALGLRKGKASPAPRCDDKGSLARLTTHRAPATRALRPPSSSTVREPRRSGPATTSRAPALQSHATKRPAAVSCSSPPTNQQTSSIATSGRTARRQAAARTARTALSNEGKKLSGKEVPPAANVRAIRSERPATGISRVRVELPKAVNTAPGRTARRMEAAKAVGATVKTKAPAPLSGISRRANTIVARTDSRPTRALRALTAKATCAATSRAAPVSRLREPTR